MSARDRAFVAENIMDWDKVIDYYKAKGKAIPPDRVIRLRNQAVMETGGLGKQDFLNAHARILREACLKLGKPLELVEHYHRLIRLLAVIKVLPENRQQNSELLKRVKDERAKFLLNDINLCRKYKILPKNFINYSMEDLSPEEMTL